MYKLYEEYEKGNININSMLDSLSEEMQNQLTKIMAIDFEIQDTDKAVDDILMAYTRERLNSKKIEILEELENENLSIENKKELEKKLSQIIIELAKNK